MLQHREPFDAFGGNDLALMWREARAVVFAINTGVVDTLFYNPYHRQQVGSVPFLRHILHSTGMAQYCV